MGRAPLHSRHGHWRARCREIGTAGSGGGRWKRTCTTGTSPTSYLTLGGKDNFAADRASGDIIAEKFPAVRTAVIENRRFLRRAVTFLAEEAGIHQFLDVGTGLPSADNTHQVAQRITPSSRIVYVDNDPLVLVHARALLTSNADGATDYVDADLRDPGRILEQASATLDLSRPLALMLLAVLPFITDDQAAYASVTRLAGALVPGSYLVISHATPDFLPPDLVLDVEPGIEASGIGMRMRSRDEVARFFDGFELVPPGIGPTSEWRAEQEAEPRPSPFEAASYCAVGRLIGQAS